MKKLFTLAVLALAVTGCASPEKVPVCKAEPHTNTNTNTNFPDFP